MSSAHDLNSVGEMTHDLQLVEFMHACVFVLGVGLQGNSGTQVLLTYLCILWSYQIHRASAIIIEPTGESDNPLRFTTGLVVALDIDATLEHVQDHQSTVKVEVKAHLPPSLPSLSGQINCFLNPLVCKSQLNCIACLCRCCIQMDRPTSFIPNPETSGTLGLGVSASSPRCTSPTLPGQVKTSNGSVSQEELVHVCGTWALVLIWVLAVSPLLDINRLALFPGRQICGLLLLFLCEFEASSQRSIQACLPNSLQLHRAVDMCKRQHIQTGKYPSSYSLHTYCY